ncbi:TetR/AcrR family transcriptional regulator [Sanguibacter sp. A247]|uniref:TetR/AcrR family transcriptional regulator n=1 Tax=unclassified Sanguibacter TaxID=2645534 RepID=UPI003FD6E5A7
MPRISAATVAEHRAMQQRAVLDAARDLLAETGHAPSLAEVGRRAGLARSSVYQYARSREDLMAAVVADVFPAWASRTRAAVDEAATPGHSVWAYVVSNVSFFSGSENRVARALGSVVDPEVLEGPMTEFHRALQEPLIGALSAHGEPDARATADIIDAMILGATRELRSRTDVIDPAERDETLAQLRRILGPYLRLESETSP